MTTVLLAHPSSDLYGSDRMALESVRALVEGGARVVVTLPGRGPLDAEVSARGGEVRHVPVPVLRRGGLSPRGLVDLAVTAARAAGPCRRVLREVRPDLVYVNTVTLPWWSATARVHRVPVVCHVHEVEPDATRPVRMVLAEPLRLARRVVLNSRYASSCVVASVPSLAARCVVVPNGVQGPPDGPVPPRDRLTGPVRLVYVGRLSERKGVFDLLDAVGLLQERGVRVHLRLVGDVAPGADVVRRRVDDRIARLPDPAAVERCGFRSAVWDEFATADIAVMVSRGSETFGNTAAEALLAGRPLVTSRDGGMAEVAQGLASTRPVAPADPSAVADAVQELVGDWEGVRTAAGVVAREAAERFDPVRYRSGIRQVVSGLVGPLPVEHP